MRYFIVLIFALLIDLCVFAAYPIIHISKADGGKHGYRYVAAEMGVTVGGTEGWLVTCTDPGRSDCRPPMGGDSSLPEGVSAEEFEEALRLVEHAENMWDEGVQSGVSLSTAVGLSGGVKTLEVTWEVIDRVIYITVNRLDD